MKDSRTKKFSQTLSTLRPFQKELVLGPLAKLLEAVLEVTLPMMMAHIVDVGITSHDHEDVLRTSLVMGVMILVSLCCAIFCQYCAAKASTGVGALLRERMFTRVNAMSTKEQEVIGTESLMVRMTTDVNQTSLAVSMLIRLVSRVPFITIGGVLAAMSIDIPMAGVLAVASVLFLITLLLIIRSTFMQYGIVEKRLDKITSEVRESILGVRVIRAFSRNKHHEDKMNDASSAYKESVIAVSKLSSLMSPVTVFIMNLSIVAVIFIGGIRVDTGAISKGDIIAFMNYIFTIVTALTILANLVVIFTRTFVSMERIEEVLRSKASERDDETESLKSTAMDKPVDDISMENQPNHPLVKFKNVSFSYLDTDDDDTDLLAVDSLSFQIRKGEKLGIIGTTGSGKSTVLALMLKLYSPTSGEIYIDGENIAEWSEERVRAQMSPVFQSPRLFRGTVRENLLLGGISMDDKELKKRLQIAMAWDFVSKMEGGLDAKVEANGRNLSGGQRQRLCIARALCHDSALLLMDDASSALDMETDEKLQATLKEHLAETGKTCVMISARIKPIVDANWILVFDNGKLVGEGKHDELLQNCEEYAKIAASQEMGGV